MRDRACIRKNGLSCVIVRDGVDYFCFVTFLRNVSIYFFNYDKSFLKQRNNVTLKLVKEEN